MSALRRPFFSSRETLAHTRMLARTTVAVSFRKRGRVAQRPEPRRRKDAIVLAECVADRKRDGRGRRWKKTAHRLQAGECDAMRASERGCRDGERQPTREKACRGLRLLSRERLRRRHPHACQQPTTGQTRGPSGPRTSRPGQVTQALHHTMVKVPREHATRPESFYFIMT